MLFADYVRGKDSTGVAVIHSNKADAGGKLSTYIYKRALPSYDFMFTPGYTSALAFTRPVLYMGHNRAATRGSVINENAHPFEVGNIVLAHNGTLTNKHSLPDEKHFDTDSETIAHLLDTKPVEEVANLMEGAWALVWWNKEERTLNFLRNNQRDFYYCTIDNEDTLMWSSTEHLLRWTCEHNKETIDFETDKAYGTVTQTEVNTLYTFPEGSTVPNLTEIVIKEKPKKTSHRRNYGVWDPKKGSMTYPSRKDSGDTKKSTRQKEEAKRKKAVMTAILAGMVGQQIPFNTTSAHTYKDKKTHGDKGQFIGGKIIKEFCDRVFPEFIGASVSISSVSAMPLTDITKASKDIWAGTLTSFLIPADADKVSLRLADVTPYPQYDVQRELLALEELDSAKKLEMLPGPSGIYIPSTDFNIMTQHGCAGCQCEITHDMADKLVWIKDDYPVCAQCVDKGKDQLLDDNFEAFGFKLLKNSYL